MKFLANFLICIDTRIQLPDGGISFGGDPDKSFSKRGVKFGSRFAAISAGNGGICTAGGITSRTGGDEQPEAASANISHQACIFRSGMFHFLHMLGFDGGEPHAHCPFGKPHLLGGRSKALRGFGSDVGFACLPLALISCRPRPVTGDIGSHQCQRECNPEAKLQ